MKKLIYLLAIASVVLGACDKKIELTPGLEDFQVTAESTTIHVGEDVHFRLEGNPDIITFYSGEFGNQYEYREGRKIGMDEVILSFTSARSGGIRQPDQLRLLTSTDYSGEADFASLQAATWTDITDRGIWPEANTFLPSGMIDISDRIAPDKPLYIAFQYIARPESEFGRWQAWSLQGFSLIGQTAMGPIPLGGMADSDFKLIEEKPDEAPSTSEMRYNATTHNLTRIVLNAPEADVDPSLLPNEVWAVSRAFETAEIDNGPDLGTGLKGNESQPLQEYVHVYETAGTYTAYFVATNASIDDSKQVIRKIEITVLEPENESD